MLAAGEAAAHALLDHAEPPVGNTVATPPREVTLWFTQKLEPAFSTVTVTNAAGQRVDTGKARVSGNQMSVSLRAGGHRNLPCEMAGAVGGHAHDQRQFHVSSRSVGARANQWTGLEHGIDGPLVVDSCGPLRCHRGHGGNPDFPDASWPGPRCVRAGGGRALSQRKPFGVAWIGLAITAASGVIWLLLQAAAMSGLPLDEAMTPDVLSTVLTQTQFGLVSEIRFVLAVILAVCLAFDRLPLSRRLGACVGVGLIAAIAWTGHAGSTPGELGILHLIGRRAASDRRGGLDRRSGFAGLLLAAARRDPDRPGRRSRASCHTALFDAGHRQRRRTLFATGIVNAWILVGSFHALIVTGIRASADAQDRCVRSDAGCSPRSTGSG